MLNEFNDEQLYILLGCYGRVDDGFVSCSSCENKILLVHPGLENYNGMMDYFDACRLIDKPAFDFNAIRSILQNMQDRFDQIGAGKRLWSEKEIRLFQKFLIDHKGCGLYLKLMLLKKAQVDEKSKLDDKQIPITSLSKQKIKNLPKLNLRLIRGRR